MALQARLGVLESKSRELLVHQGSSVSGASVALSALIGRLDGLVEELVVAYSISDQELEVSNITNIISIFGNFSYIVKLQFVLRLCLRYILLMENNN